MATVMVNYQGKGYRLMLGLIVTSSSR